MIDISFCKVGLKGPPHFSISIEAIRSQVFLFPSLGSSFRLIVKIIYFIEFYRSFIDWSVVDLVFVHSGKKRNIIKKPWKSMKDSQNS